MMSNTELINEFLEKIENEKLSNKIKAILEWIKNNYPDFKHEYKWNQPMITSNGTYIMGFSISKKHIGVGLEAVVMDHFKGLLDDKLIEHGKMIFRIKEDDVIDFYLLKQIIDYVVILKKDVKTFWL